MNQMDAFYFGLLGLFAGSTIVLSIWLIHTFRNLPTC